MPMTMKMKFSELYEKKMLRDGRQVYDTYPDIAKAMGISERLAFDLKHDRWAKVELIDSMCKYLGATAGELFVDDGDSIQEKPVKKKVTGSKK